MRFPANSVSFNLPDGIVKAQDMSGGNIITKLLNDVEIKDGKNVNEFSLYGEWRYSQEKLNEEIAKNSVITISQVPFRPNLVKDGGEIKKMKNFLSPESYNCQTNEDGTKQLIEILGKDVFDNPKPVGMIETLLKASTYNNKNAIILDFFAGSGTTGQAVLELNKEDSGNRKFILCTNNEITEKNTNGVAFDVTSKRLKRVMTGECYDKSKDFKLSNNGFEPYGNSLDVYEIETVANFEKTIGKTPFDVIDETNYNIRKFENIKDKIEWVCNNFEITEKNIESYDGWKKRMEEK